MDKNYSFPTSIISSKDKIERDFLLLNNTKATDKSLHFKIGMSKKWKMADIQIQELSEENPLVTLALFRRVENPVAEIEVIAAQIPCEIDPANWLVIHLKNHGFKLLQMQRLPSPTGDVGDILAEVETDSGTFVARALAIKDGSRVFSVVCQAQDNNYEEVAEEFYMAISKFNLLNPTGQKYAEPMKPYQIKLPINCKFLFPEVWVEKKDSSPPPFGSAFSLVSFLKGNWMGQFTFASIRRQDEVSYEGLYSNYLEQLEENDIEVEPIALNPSATGAGFDGMWSGILSAVTDEDEPLEVRCCILAHSSAWLLFAIAGPDWELSPEAQSINYRAFQIALETLSLAKE